MTETAYPFENLKTRKEAAIYCRVCLKTFDRMRRHPAAPPPVWYKKSPLWSTDDLNEIITLFMREKKNVRN